jgi:hypothetical protein
MPRVGPARSPATARTLPPAQALRTTARARLRRRASRHLRRVSRHRAAAHPRTRARPPARALEDTGRADPRPPPAEASRVARSGPAFFGSFSGANSGRHGWLSTPTSIRPQTTNLMWTSLRHWQSPQYRAGPVQQCCRRLGAGTRGQDRSRSGGQQICPPGPGHREAGEREVITVSCCPRPGIGRVRVGWARIHDHGTAEGWPPGPRPCRPAGR